MNSVGKCSQPELRACERPADGASEWETSPMSWDSHSRSAGRAACHRGCHWEWPVQLAPLLWDLPEVLNGRGLYADLLESLFEICVCRERVSQLERGGGS